MAWTPEHRRRYAPAITEAVRANAIARLAATVDAIDPPARTGRPRLWSTLVMLQALWWLCRAGAAWRLLPPRSTHQGRPSIGSRLERWVEHAVLERALAVLDGCLRLAKGRKRQPAAGILGTQSVRAGPQRGPRGFDAGKKVKGRKRQALVDTDGRALLLEPHPANIQDRDAGGAMLKVSRAFFPFITHVFADSAYDHDRVRGATSITVEIVRKPPDQVGSAVHPRRWVVERFFAWIGRCRRLAKDFEGTTKSARALLYAASVLLLTRRLARAA